MEAGAGSVALKKRPVRGTATAGWAKDAKKLRKKRKNSRITPHQILTFRTHNRPLLFLTALLSFSSALFPLNATAADPGHKTTVLYDFDFQTGDHSVWGANSEDNTQLFKTELVPGETGKCLRLEYDVDSPRPAYGGIIFPFAQSVPDEYRSVLIDARCTTKAGETIQLDLSSGGDTGVYFLSGIKPEWQTFIIPIKRFAGITPGKSLEKLTVVLRDDGANCKEGSFFFDNIALSSKPLKKSDLLPEEDRAAFLVNRLRGFTHNRLKSFKPPKNDGELLRAVAADTWKFFDEIVDAESNMPLDTINLKPLFIGDYTSTTNMGLYMMSIVSAFDFGFIDRATAVKRLKAILETASGLASYKGFIFNYFDTTTRYATSNFISFVDSGWFTAGVIIAGEAFPEELSEKCYDLLKTRDFGFFYDREAGLMRHGFNLDTASFAKYHYGAFFTEARGISAIAIGRGQAPEEHWFKMHRAFPPEWDWTRQTPQGNKQAEYAGVTVIEGYYEAYGIKLVPSWGGSMFEALMPTLIINEAELARKSLGANGKRHIQAQIKHAQEKGYPVWGFSPCTTPGGGYGEYGVPYAGIKGYDGPVVTPHAAVLALSGMPEEAVENIRILLENYPGIYGPYGFYDSVNVETGNISYKYLALDQAMIFITLNNYLNDGAIQDRFKNTHVFRKFKKTHSKEEFNIF